METVVPPQEETVDVAGVPTVVRSAGEGAPMLFLHGAFFPTRWLPFHDELARGARVIAPLHPGYAEGAPPDWLRGFDDLAIHYHDLLDHLGADRVDLVGYDLGGWIAAEVASFYPERVRSLTLIAPFGLRVPDAPIFEFLSSDPERVADALFGGHGERFPELVVDPKDIPAFVESYGHNGVTARLMWERRYDLRLERRAGRLRAPALVVAARDDRIVPLAHAQRWAELLPDARLETLDGVSHALVVEEPARVVRAVNTFVSEVAR